MLSHAHTSYILIFLPSFLLCVHSDLHTLAGPFSKYIQRAPILDAPLHYSLSPEVVACLDLYSLLGVYSDVTSLMRHSLIPYLKMALPLSLFLTFILCRIHHPWTNYICTYFFYLLSFFSHLNVSYTRAEFCLFCSLLYSKSLEQLLAKSSSVCVIE